MCRNEKTMNKIGMAATGRWGMSVFGGSLLLAALAADDVAVVRRCLGRAVSRARHGWEPSMRNYRHEGLWACHHTSKPA